jgi:hypothetical protein
VLLTEKVAEFDAALPDWEVARLLNEPDPALPEEVQIKSRMIGPGLIMETLGADSGAAVLDALEMLSATVPRVKWAMFLLKGAGVDAGSQVVRNQLDELATQGIITAAQADLVKRLGEIRRYPSWAEHNGIEVTARTVGLARGGM